MKINKGNKECKDFFNNKMKINKFNNRKIFILKLYSIKKINTITKIYKCVQQKKQKKEQKIRTQTYLNKTKIKNQIKAFALKNIKDQQLIPNKNIY